MNTPFPIQSLWVRPKDARVYRYSEWIHAATRKRLWKRLYSLARHQHFSIRSAPNGRAFMLSQGKWSSNSFSADYDGLMDAYTLLESVCEM